MADYNFQKELKKQVFESNLKMSRGEILEDIFKSYVAKMLEQNVRKNLGRLEADFVLALKGYMITEFRKADLAEFQKSEAQYSGLFDAAMKEIYEFAANNHKGYNNVEMDTNQQLEVNIRAYQNEKAKNNLKVSDGGIILPN